MLLNKNKVFHMLLSKNKAFVIELNEYAAIEIHINFSSRHIFKWYKYCKKLEIFAKFVFPNNVKDS